MGLPDLANVFVYYCYLTHYHKFGSSKQHQFYSHSFRGWESGTVWVGSLFRVSLSQNQDGQAAISPEAWGPPPSSELAEFSSWWPRTEVSVLLLTVN